MNETLKSRGPRGIRAAVVAAASVATLGGAGLVVQAAFAEQAGSSTAGKINEATGLLSGNVVPMVPVPGSARGVPESVSNMVDLATLRVVGTGDGMEVATGLAQRPEASLDGVQLGGRCVVVTTVATATAQVGCESPEFLAANGAAFAHRDPKTGVVSGAVLLPATASGISVNGKTLPDNSQVATFAAPDGTTVTVTFTGASGQRMVSLGPASWR